MRTPIVKKKGDLTGAGKGDWLRVGITDRQYIKNYNKIFGEKQCPSLAGNQKNA